MGLDGDAALALEIHVVQQLVALVALGHGARQLQQPVGQRRLAVVDVRDDAEIADERQVVRRTGRRRRGATGRRFVGVFLVEFRCHGIP
jgi:hypothetical protein